MKLGTFILAALCVATPAFADHQKQIEQYQHAYGSSGDPHLLVLIANEYRAAGNQHDALAFYCSYIFTAPAGDDADYASQQAHVLKPGAESDHDACTRAPAVTGTRQVEIIDALPPALPRISKREIGGIALVGLSAVGFGVGLYEASQSSHYQSLLAGVDPRMPRTPATIALQSKANRAEAGEKWFLASGALAIVAGGVLYLSGRHDRIEAGQIVVAPTAHRHGAGVAVSGAF